MIAFATASSAFGSWAAMPSFFPHLASAPATVAVDEAAAPRATRADLTRAIFDTRARPLDLALRHLRARQVLATLSPREKRGLDLLAECLVRMSLAEREPAS
jgi:hypothetical protein